MKKLDISQYLGQKFGRLIIVKEVDSIQYKKTKMRKVLCKCECGTEKEIDLNSIKRGKSVSCGCFNKEHAKETHTKHGLAMLSTGIRHPDYCIWMKMKSRCFNTNDKSYKNYGERGIIVCDRWKNSFENFITDLGWRPSNDYSLERLNYNGDYCPDNCKWILKSEQTKNSRRVKQIIYNNKRQCLTEWCKELNLNYATMRHRIYDLNISFEEAIRYPKHYKFKKTDDKSNNI